MQKSLLSTVTIFIVVLILLSGCVKDSNYIENNHLDGDANIEVNGIEQSDQENTEYNEQNSKVSISIVNEEST